MRFTWMIVGLVLIIVIAVALVVANRSRQRTEAVSNPVARFEGERQQAIEAARQAHGKAKAAGQDLEPGPCLGVVVPNWVADVAHEPRQPVDNLKENQCEQFINREAQHFVELDPQGNLIRAL